MKLIHIIKGKDVHLVFRIFVNHILFISDKILKLGIGRIQAAGTGFIFVENDEKSAFGLLSEVFLVFQPVGSGRQCIEVTGAPHFNAAAG